MHHQGWAWANLCNRNSWATPSAIRPPGADQRTARNDGCATVLAGIVGIRNRPGCQITEDLRIVDLAAAILSPGDKQVGIEVHD